MRLMPITDALRAAAHHLPAPLYRVVHQVRVKQAIRGYPERLVTHSYGHGVTLTISIKDPLAEGWYDHGNQHDWTELEPARAHGLKTGARVFDIGAHQGVVALVIADIVGPTGRVLAVEAERHNARVAERNAQLNGAAQVTVLQAACAATSGTLTFQEGLNGRVAVGGRLGTTRTRSVTVDELADLYGTPDVVYLDIEGHEAQAIKGATKTMVAGATFVVEVHGSGQLQAYGGTVEEIVHSFRSHGYELLYKREDDERSGRPFDVLVDATMPRSERFFLLATRASPT